MRRWMLAGNWKMHNTIGESIELARAIEEGTAGRRRRGNRCSARLYGTFVRLCGHQGSLR